MLVGLCSAKSEIVLLVCFVVLPTYCILRCALVALGCASSCVANCTTDGEEIAKTACLISPEGALFCNRVLAIVFFIVNKSGNRQETEQSKQSMLEYYRRILPELEEKLLLDRSVWEL